MAEPMQLEKPDFVELLQVISSGLNTRLVDKHVALNSSVGQGYLWAERLPCGITVMVSDTNMVNDAACCRLENEDQFYTLQFNEETEVAGAVVTGKSVRRNMLEFQSYVKLTHTVAPETFVFPSGKKLRSVKFFFNKSHLSLLLGEEAVEEVLNQYFPLLIKNNSLEPITTDYRILLNELLTEKIQQPLRLNYLQNRVLMLLEKFILKHLQKGTNGKKVKRTHDETLRLMKVEALLVKDFGVQPPSIDELSKISAMSSTKLKNDFKSLYELPIYEYYQKNRMIKARSLLMQGLYSIKEVGLMVGYSNLSHFANTFKKEFGFLPSELATKDGVLVYNS